MKNNKVLIFIGVSVIILILIWLTLIHISSSYCNESDNGFFPLKIGHDLNQIYERGDIQGKYDGMSFQGQDDCIDSKYLREYSCGDSNNREINIIFCDKGCSNGACIK